MQISAAITEKYISIYGLVNIPDHGTKMVFTSMFSGSINHAWSDLMCCSENIMQISFNLVYNK